LRGLFDKLYFFSSSDSSFYHYLKDLFYFQMRYIHILKYQKHTILKNAMCHLHITKNTYSAQLTQNVPLIGNKLIFIFILLDYYYKTLNVFFYILLKCAQQECN